MDAAARHQRISELFLQASELEGTARRSFLVEACGDDSSLLDEVRSLLAAGEDSILVDRTLRSDVLAELAVDEQGKTRPERIGDYEILAILGEGGMGTVYRAKQSKPEREVALKVVRTGFADEDTLRRFELETHLLGRLQHPGIAQIHEAGVAHSSLGRQPFLVMELVDGPSLDEYSEGRSVEERIELIAGVAEAVQHAHERGVLHRDLKPSNVLVDPHGQVKVLDFGVARAIDDTPGGTLLTRPGQIVGTLAWMAPEQIHGQADVRSDVYALGVMAFRLMAGRSPIEVTGLSVPQAAQRILEAEPKKLGQLDRRLRGDLETIVAKALAKDPARRYVSAAALADDLRRFLRHEPVSARPPSSIYQLGRLARRHRAVFAGASLALLFLIAGLIGALVFAQRSQEAREESDEVVTFLSELLMTSHPDSLGHEARVVDALDQAARKLDQRSLAHRPSLEARLRYTLGRAYYALGVMDRSRGQLDRSRAIWEQQALEAPLDLLRLTARLHIEHGEYEAGLEAAHNLVQAALAAGDLEQEIQARGIGVRALMGQVRFEEAGEGVLIAIEACKEQGLTAQAFYFDLLDSYSEILRQTGHLAESMEPLKDLVALSTEQHGPTHTTTLAQRLAVATRRFEMGEIHPAREELEEILELCETHLGEDATSTINTLEQLSMVYRNTGQMDQAREAIERVAEQRAEVFGPKYIGVVLANLELAKIYLAQNQIPKALELADACHLASLELEGPSAMVTLTAAAAVTNCYYRRQEYAQAADICQAALDDAVDTPPASPIVLQMRSLVAACFQQLGRLEEAKEILLDMLPLAEDCFGPEHPQVFIFHKILADILRDLGDAAGAIEMYRSAADGLEGTYGAQHAFVSGARAEAYKLEARAIEASAPK